MTAGPLAGRTVVVTRAAEQASRLSDALRSYGATALELPLLSIVPPLDAGAALDEAVSRLESFAWVIVASPNGATALLQALARRVRPLEQIPKIAAVGPVTGHSLSNDPRLVVSLTGEVSTAKALAETFPTGDGEVLCVVGDRSGRLIPDELERRGWRILSVVSYRTQAVYPTTVLRASVAHSDALTLMSGSAAEAFVQHVGVESVPRTVFSIGPSTTAAAQRLGLVVTATATEHTSEGLARCVANQLR